MFNEYSRLRDGLTSLRNGFLTTGSHYGSLIYDEYRVLPWMKHAMPRYRVDFERSFAERHPNAWSEWCMFQTDELFGRLHGDRSAYEPFVRMANVAVRSLMRIARLIEDRQSPESAHISLPKTDNDETILLGVWLHLLVTTAQDAPTPLLQVEGVTSSYPFNFLMRECETVTALPEYLLFEIEGRPTPGLPIRVTLQPDLFRNSAEVLRLWLGESGTFPGELPVRLPKTNDMPRRKDVQDRVVINEAALTVTIDDEPFACENDEARELIRVLAEANGEVRSFAQIQVESELLSLVTHSTRLMRRVPEPLRRFVESVPGKGYQLNLSNEQERNVSRA